LAGQRIDGRHDNGLKKALKKGNLADKGRVTTV
jgi:hypothetical protein